MKVLMLNGSGNANGSTRAGLDVMAEVFAENGVETERKSSLKTVWRQKSFA